MNWFESSVKRVMVSPSGKTKKISEKYLVYAENVAEAEERVLNLVPDAVVSAVTERNIAEVYDDLEGTTLYRAKIDLLTVNEKNGDEKRESKLYYLPANNVKRAVDLFLEKMQGCMMDFEVMEVASTKIVDVMDGKE